MSSTAFPTTAPEKLTLRALARPGLVALGMYWRPFVLIQICALALVLSFFFVAPVTRACEWMAGVMDQVGLPGAMLAAGLAGGVLPEIAKIVSGMAPQNRKTLLNDLAFNFCYFAFAGLCVYLFYALQSKLFGDSQAVLTVAKKVALDLGMFTVVWAIPSGVLIFSFRRHRYSFASMRQELTPSWFLIRVTSLLIPCWGFWLPMTSMIYSLPKALQFGLFSLALAAWSLLLVFLASRK